MSLSMMMSAFKFVIEVTFRMRSLFIEDTFNELQF